MSIIKKILLLLLLLGTISYGSAQDLSKKSAGQLKNLGKNALIIGDTYSAIDYFEAYLQKKETDYKTMLTLGKCYYASRDYENAKEWFKKAYDGDNKKCLEGLFHYANMLMVSQKYEEAYDNFKKFKKIVYKENRKDMEELKRLCSMKMQSCELAPVLMDSTVVVWVTHLDTSINKQSVEFSPMYIDDSTFVYASLRSDTAVYAVIGDTSQIVPARQFYKGTKKTRSWTYAGAWETGDFNIPEVNTGNGVFSPDKKRFYFTRCEKNWKYEVICSIYQSEKEDGKWSTPEKLPENINNPKYTSTQPAVGTDSKRGEEILYFVSNNPEGKGGLDIWYSVYRKRKKEWKDPRNCGSKINSKGNEVTPFVDLENRDFYFSSDGWIGMGELDIYRATGEMSKWMPNENIGYPLNSGYDDLYYVLNTNGEEGFFVSNRPGGVNTIHPTCCDDLYTFKYNEIIKVGATGQVYSIVDEDIEQLFNEKFETIEIKKEEDKLGLDTSEYTWAEGVIVSLYLIDSQNKDLIYIKNDTTDANGEYFFNLVAGKDYALEFENYGNFNKKVKVTTKGIVESDTIHLQHIGVNLVPKQPMIVKNVYYDFDKSVLSSKAKRVIDTTLLVVMRETPQIVIEISSHTDSKGEAEYNKKLSQARAESVVNYLIKKGIDSKRLYAKGYGEEKPIAPNENPDGSDNPEGREKNRRTEFKIIGSLDQYSEIIYEE